jgi:hypothetical protein
MVEILAELYPATDDPVRIAGEAGIAPQYVDWRGAAVEVWHRVVVRASWNEAELHALGEIAAGEFPDQAPRIRRAFRRNEEPSSASRPVKIFEGPGGRPALSVPHFIGHEQELNMLGALLSDADAPACVVTCGHGGVGKSALIQHFVATQAPRLFPDGAIWLDATIEPFELELARTARRFGHGLRATAHAEVDPATWLARRLNGRRVLVIIDDVDLRRLDHQKLLVPGGGCRTLITTRSKTLHDTIGVSTGVLRVEPWSQQASRDYLRSAVTDLAAEEAELDQLANFAGGLPLALCLIAKHLNRPGKQAKQLCEQLEKRSLEKLDEVQEGAVKGVAATFEAAVADLRARERSALLALAWCASATRASVVAQVADMDEEEAESALAELDERYLAIHSPGALRPWRMQTVMRRFVRGLPDSDVAREAHVRFAFACAERLEEHDDFSAVESDGAEVWSAFRRLFLGDTTSKERAYALLSTMQGYLSRARDSGEIVSPDMRCEMSVINANPVATRELLAAIQRFIDLSPLPLASASSTFPPASR